MSLESIANSIKSRAKCLANAVKKYICTPDGILIAGLLTSYIALSNCNEINGNRIHIDKKSPNIEMQINERRKDYKLVSYSQEDADSAIQERVNSYVDLLFSDLEKSKVFPRIERAAIRNRKAKGGVIKGGYHKFPKGAYFYSDLHKQWFGNPDYYRVTDKNRNQKVGVGLTLGDFLPDKYPAHPDAVKTEIIPLSKDIVKALSLINRELYHADIDPKKMFEFDKKTKGKCGKFLETFRPLSSSRKYLQAPYTLHATGRAVDIPIYSDFTGDGIVDERDAVFVYDFVKDTLKKYGFNIGTGLYRNRDPYTRDKAPFFMHVDVRLYDGEWNRRELKNIIYAAGEKDRGAGGHSGLIALGN